MVRARGDAEAKPIEFQEGHRLPANPDIARTIQAETVECFNSLGGN